MKLSLKWAQQYSNFDLLKDGEEKLLEKIGSQLGAIDEVTRWGEKYEGIVIVKIAKCEPHPNADNLKLCWVDDNGVISDVERGSDGLVQVVCGGPNARADMFAAWIPPGVTVPSSLDKSPLILEVREIRGQKSNGMLASPSELCISDEHNGILEVKADDINREPQPGELIKGLYDLDDTVVDIENKMFTHRPDLFGILGIARELAGISHQKFLSPDWYLNLPQDSFKQTAFEELDFNVENQEPLLVPRFLSIAMSDIKIGPSPYWMQAGLTRVGIKPINNVVDITNFVMCLTGQPLHAFDYDKVKAKGSAGLEARLAKNDEELTLLGGKTIKLTKDNIVIASLGGPAIAMGGVMGGADTEVDENTKNIIIECANFDMYSIRKTSMQYGLFTDAATRYTKGQSPLQNDVVLAYAVEQMSQIAGGKTASKLFDINNLEKSTQTIAVDIEFINSRLGLELSNQDGIKYLENVEIGVITMSRAINIDVPFWRTDLEIKEDIVEEVGRLHGFDKLPSVLPFRDITPVSTSKSFALKSQIRQIMSSAGANELLTYSFVNANLLNMAGQKESLAFHIRNALSPDLQFYRMSLVPSLLEKVHANIKLGYSQFSLFELGKIYAKTELDQKLPVAQHRLGVVVNRPTKSASYYNAKYFLEYLLSDFNIHDYSFEPLANCQRSLSRAWLETASNYEPQRSAGIVFGSAIIGIVGEPNSRLKRALKLPNGVSSFELDTNKLVELSRHTSYQQINKFPSTQQEITLKMPQGTSFAVANEVIDEFFINAQREHGYDYRLEPLNIFAKEVDSEYKNVSWSIELWHRKKTLVTDEVNKLLEELAKKAFSEISAEKL